VATIALLVHDTIIAFNATDIVVEIIALTVFGGLFFLHRRKQNTIMVSHTLIVTVFLLLDITWYFNKGLGLDVALLFIAALVIAQVLIVDKFRLILSVGVLINMLLIVSLEAYWDDFTLYGQYNADSENPFLTKSIFIIITFGITSWVISKLKEEYDKAYRMTLNQQKKLVEQNKNIQAINESLEQKVDERSREAITHQKKLMEYAFFHSHNLRGPLTNLLTMHEALQLNDLEIDERAVLINKLEEETRRLDDEVRDIQESLQRQDISDYYYRSGRVQRND
jgi:signal transduction histidine kinase